MKRERTNREDIENFCPKYHGLLTNRKFLTTKIVENSFIFYAYLYHNYTRRGIRRKYLR